MLAYFVNYMVEVKEQSVVVNTRVEVLLHSIQGVRREIATRDQTLRNMKAWYLDPSVNGQCFSVHTFYEKGHKLMREINKLKLIRIELTYLLNINRILG